MSVTKVLVANRGEIAVRVIRTLRQMRIPSVAVYADQDLNTLPCDLADEAWALEGTTVAQTYMNGAALLEVAQKSGADAIHPGYGFLSEDAAFVADVEAAGITWLGPSSGAIERLGDKMQARSLAHSAHVQTIPGCEVPLDENGVETVLKFASEAGYPLVIKLANSGGGRGITRVDSDADVQRYFDDHVGDPNLEHSFVEKLMLNCRHVETQSVRDQAGHFQVVSTRDCSVQRRNQKVVEEAPAPFLKSHTNEMLDAYSKALFEAAGYVGVGTCEYLVDRDGNVFFLEVNPRLQVEHTVSEEVAGIDLVAEQVRIARGENLHPVTGGHGCAIEVRVTSEDPANDLMPASGTVTGVVWPGGPGVRIDSYLRPGDAIGGAFDSLIGKVTVTAPTRPQAIRLLQGALTECAIQGVPTSIPLLEAIIEHPDFQSLDPSGSPQVPADSADVLADESETAADSSGDHQYAVHTKWLEQSHILEDLAENGAESNEGTSGEPQSTPEELDTSLTDLSIEIDGRRTKLRVPQCLITKNGVGGGAVGKDAKPLTAQPLLGKRKTNLANQAGGDGQVTAPIQGTVVRVVAKEGQTVEQGQTLLVLEAMKMEKRVDSPCDGVVEDIAVETGDAVSAGQLIVTVKKAEQAGEGDE